MLRMYSHSLKKNEFGESYWDPNLMGRTSVRTASGSVSEGQHRLTWPLLQDHLHEGSFSVITAHNPHNKETPHEENLKRNEVLENHLKSMGAIYHKGIGAYGRKEDVFMVHHTAKVSPQQIEALAHQHGQESVFHSSKGNNRMVYLHGEHAGKHVRGQGFTHDNKLTDYYTQLDAPEDKWSGGLDFDNKHISGPEHMQVKKSGQGKRRFYSVTFPVDGGDRTIHFHL